MALICFRLTLKSVQWNSKIILQENLFYAALLFHNFFSLFFC
jgi:hypothetical protein